MCCLLFVLFSSSASSFLLALRAWDDIFCTEIVTAVFMRVLLLYMALCAVESLIAESNFLVVKFINFRTFTLYRGAGRAMQTEHLLHSSGGVFVFLVLALTACTPNFRNRIT